MLDEPESPEWAEAFEAIPDYDPSSPWWSASLIFPRPSRLSDEDMQLHFPDRDGRWCSQTKAAVQQHGARGLDLNDNWALVEPSWRCPSCGRAKAEIFRLSKRGVLLAKLELHHDHMRDEVWPRAEALFGAGWRDTAVSGSTDVLDPIQELVSRFREALVCSECNAADGKVKARFRSEVDLRFTFTAAEIARFVSARPGADHAIDHDAALAIWRGQERGHRTRVTLLEGLLAQLGEGLLASERTGRTGARPMGMRMGQDELLRAKFLQETWEDERWGLLSGYRQEFLARSTSRDSAALPPVRVGKSGEGPSDSEYASYEDPVSRKRWLVTSDEWSCPVCGRHKRELLRRSGKGKWTGGIREHHEYLDERDPETISVRLRLFPGFENEFWISGLTTVEICSDCSEISRAARQRNRGLEGSYLKLSELRDCISRAAPHQPHEIDFAEAERRLVRNGPYASADDACRRYESLLGKIRVKIESWTASGLTHAEALADVAEDLRVYHGIEDVGERERLTRWLAENAFKAREADD